MDRCRCEEYAAAVSNLKYYTVGTHRPDIIENYDRSGYCAIWIKQGVSLNDLKFMKPKAYKISEGTVEFENESIKEKHKVEKMWCPFLKIVRKM